MHAVVIVTVLKFVQTKNKQNNNIETYDIFPMLY